MMGWVVLPQFYGKEEQDAEDKHLAKNGGRGKASARHTNCSSIVPPGPCKSPSLPPALPKLLGGLPWPLDCMDRGNSGHPWGDQPSTVSPCLAVSQLQGHWRGPCIPRALPSPQRPAQGQAHGGRFPLHWTRELLKYLRYACLQRRASVVNERGIKEISAAIPSKRNFLNKQNLGSF